MSIDDIYKQLTNEERVTVVFVVGEQCAKQQHQQEQNNKEKGEKKTKNDLLTHGIQKDPLFVFLLLSPSKKGKKFFSLFCFGSVPQSISTRLTVVFFIVYQVLERCSTTNLGWATTRRR